MGFLLILAVVALGAIAWLLFRIDAKLQAIGDMIHDASRPEGQRRLSRRSFSEGDIKPSDKEDTENPGGND